MYADPQTTPIPEAAAPVRKKYEPKANMITPAIETVGGIVGVIGFFTFQWVNSGNYSAFDLFTNAKVIVQNGGSIGIAEILDIAILGMLLVMLSTGIIGLVRRGKVLDSDFPITMSVLGIIFAAVSAAGVSFAIANTSSPQLGATLSDFGLGPIFVMVAFIMGIVAKSIANARQQ